MNLKKNIQKIEVNQQIQTLMLSVFENYNVKKIDKVLSEIQKLENLDYFQLLKSWYESEEQIEVRCSGLKNLTQRLEFLFLAIDLLLILDIREIKLQVFLTNSEREVFETFKNWMSFDYEFFESEEMSYNFIVKTPKEDYLLIKSHELGFDLDLKSLYQLSLEQKCFFIQLEKQHAYLLVQQENLDLKISQLTQKLRSQGFSVDRNYQFLSNLEEEKKLLELIESDLLIRVKNNLEVEIENRENHKKYNYPLEALFIDFSSIYEETFISE